MVIGNLLGVPFHATVVIGLGLDFLFKSVLAVSILKRYFLIFHNVLVGLCNKYIKKMTMLLQKEFQLIVICD